MNPVQPVAYSVRATVMQIVQAADSTLTPPKSTINVSVSLNALLTAPLENMNSTMEAISVLPVIKPVRHVMVMREIAKAAPTLQVLYTTIIQIMSVIKLAPMDSMEIAATTNALPATMSAPSVSEPVPPTALNAKLTPVLTIFYSTAAPVAFPHALMVTTK